MSLYLSPVCSIGSERVENIGSKNKAIEGCELIDNKKKDKNRQQCGSVRSIC